MQKEFVQVDAFTNRSLYGNPAAVVFDADDIPAETMQRIAREMNLSETVFILKPTTTEADYRVRIFTPMNELPFAGHPATSPNRASRSAAMARSMLRGSGTATPCVCASAAKRLSPPAGNCSCNVLCALEFVARDRVQLARLMSHLPNIDSNGAQSIAA